MTYIASKALGITINKKRMRRIMKENNLLSGVRRKRYSDEVYKKLKELKNEKPEDLINRHFFAMVPKTRMLVDITYLPGKEQTYYLNTIEDLYNGEIVAWEIQDHPNAQLCMDTVMKLKKSGANLKDVIIHNDLGSSYMSKAYRGLLEELGIRISVGKKGSCYDNAPMESLNGIIKTEGLYCRFGKSRVEHHKIPFTSLIAAVTQFIFYYNHKRPKEALRGMSPVEFREQNPHGKYLVPISVSKLDNTRKII